MSALRGSFGSSSLLTLLAIAALGGMADRALFLFIPIYLSQTLNMSTANIGLHLGLLALLGVASGPVIGSISDRIGRKRMIAMVLFCSALFPPIMVNSGLGVMLTVSIALFGFFIYQTEFLIQTAAMDIAAHLKLEGTFIGILWGTHALFGALSPVIAGAMAEAAGFATVFYYGTALFLIGSILALTLRTS